VSSGSSELCAREQGVGVIQISQKDFGWKHVGAVERRIRAGWDSVRDRADLKWQVVK